MANVYLETSFISAAVSDRTDAHSVYRRDRSVEWLNSEASRHDCFASAEVIGEIQHPRFRRRHQALALLANVPLLPIDDEVVGVARILIEEKVMPGPLAGDAIHVAVATVNNMEYMLTWNVRHLANMNKLRHLQEICRRIGVVAPAIITPDLLWEQER